VHDVGVRHIGDDVDAGLVHERDDVGALRSEDGDLGGPPARSGRALLA
jgi:hypothetical protein